MRVFTFLFHLLYIYECICIWVWGSTIPPLSRSPHLYSDLTPLLSRISPSSPSLLIPASALGVLLAPAPLRLPLHNIPPKYPLPFPPTLPPFSMLPPSLPPSFSDKNVIYTASERKGNSNRVKRYLVNLKKNSILELYWKCNFPMNPQMCF